MIRRSYTIVEALTVCALSGLCLSGLVVLGQQTIQVQRAHLRAAWQVQDQALISQRWRAFVAKLSANQLQISEAAIVAGETTADVQGDILRIDKRVTRLPEGTTVAFARLPEDPQVLTLSIRVPNEASLCFLARTQPGGAQP